MLTIRESLQYVRLYPGNGYGLSCQKTLHEFHMSLPLLETLPGMITLEIQNRCNYNKMDESRVRDYFFFQVSYVLTGLSALL